MGKIGLAVTPADPSLVYATIEAGEEERGFYRSRDQRRELGEAERLHLRRHRPALLPGARGLAARRRTGLPDGRLPPRDPRWRRDDGDRRNRPRQAQRQPRPVDRPGRTAAICWSGTDAGLYESFDEAQTFRHFPNLPVSQIYKVALNDREPFYDILVGRRIWDAARPLAHPQPDGIRNQDWYVPLGADGYGVAFDPRDPDLLYLMYQEGKLYRRDRRNEESADDPAPARARGRAGALELGLAAAGEPAPTPSGSTTARSGVWRSDDRGDSWTPISGDLTLGAEPLRAEVLRAGLERRRAARQRRRCRSTPRPRRSPSRR